MPNLLDSMTLSSPSAHEAAPKIHPAGSSPLFSRFHGLRRVADKAKRRLKSLVGKPDNSPWVMRPESGAKSTTYVDFMFGLDYLSPNAPLTRLFKEAMGAYGLSMLLVNDKNVEKVIDDVDRGWLRPHVYVDLGSALSKPLWTLMEVLDKQGIYAIPKLGQIPEWPMKAWAQPYLEAAGLPVPPSIIFKKDDPDRDLTAQERAKVGDSVVIKPSFGVAGLGVVVGAEPTAAVIGKARDYARHFDWLVQKKISWMSYVDRPAYVRAYNVFGHRSLLWWGSKNGFQFYDILTWEDAKKYDLLPILDFTDKLTELSKIDFFSSEVAILADSGPNRFMLIDYINDQCDMDPEPAPQKKSVPEPWARWVCQCCAEFVYRKKHNLPAPEGRSLHLF